MISEDQDYSKGSRIWNVNEKCEIGELGSMRYWCWQIMQESSKIQWVHALKWLCFSQEWCFLACLSPSSKMPYHLIFSVEYGKKYNAYHVLVHLTLYICGSAFMTVQHYIYEVTTVFLSVYFKVICTCTLHQLKFLLLP